MNFNGKVSDVRKNDELVNKLPFLSNAKSQPPEINPQTIFSSSNKG
jgi:hypothetical protein